MSVSVVIQRFRDCKLLVDELAYVAVGGGDKSCGLLAYISFSSSTTESQVEQAASMLLNLPVLTTGLWGDGSSSTRSILALAAEEPSSCALVIVPQANLISKVKQGGKSIQYHGQINKEKGQELYAYFCEYLKGALLEAQCLKNSEELPDWYKKRRSFFVKQISNMQASPDTPPNELFGDASKYRAWDEQGFPIKDAEGGDLTKSQIKKLKKIYVAHCKRHTKWKEQQDKKDTSYTEQISGPPPAQWDECLDPSFCHFVAGSFGKRQGLEFRSDMGPFVHSFQV